MRRLRHKERLRKAPVSRRFGKTAYAWNDFHSERDMQAVPTVDKGQAGLFFGVQAVDNSVHSVDSYAHTFDLCCICRELHIHCIFQKPRQKSIQVEEGAWNTAKNKRIE